MKLKTALACPENPERQELLQRFANAAAQFRGQVAAAAADHIGKNTCPVCKMPWHNGPVWYCMG